MSTVAGEKTCHVCGCEIDENDYYTSTIYHERFYCPECAEKIEKIWTGQGKCEDVEEVNGALETQPIAPAGSTD